MEESEVRFMAVKVDQDGNIVDTASSDEVKDAVGDTMEVAGEVPRDQVRNVYTNGKENKESPKKNLSPQEKNIHPLKKPVKKKSRWKKLKEAMFGQDVENVPEFVIYDILIPAFKKLLADMVNGAVGMALFGDANARRKDRNRTHVSMSSIYEDRNNDRYSGRSGRTRSKVNDIIFDSRNDAETVLDQLIDLVDDYGMASLQDLYFMVGYDSVYTDANYGWTNLRGASVSACSDGYFLNLPPVKALQ